MVIWVTELEAKALVHPRAEVGGIGAGVSGVIRVSGQGAIDGAGLGRLPGTVYYAHLHIPEVFSDEIAASVLADEDTDGPHRKGIRGEAHRAVGGIDRRRRSGRQRIVSAASPWTAAVVGHGRIDVCGTAVGQRHLELVSIRVTHPRVEAKVLVITGERSRGIGKLRCVIARSGLGIDAGVNKEIFVGGPGGDSGVSAAVGEG